MIKKKKKNGGGGGGGGGGELGCAADKARKEFGCIMITQ